MNDTTLIIRADADSQVGTGHIMRCIALAQEWHDQGGEVSFISRCDSKKLRERISKEGFRFISIDNPFPIQNDLDQTIAFLKHFSPALLVLDGYHFTPDYQKSIRDEGCLLIAIDDINHLSFYHADVLVNQNIYAPDMKYQCDQDTILLLGSHYVALRKEFREYREIKRQIKEQAKNILVTLGGADKDNVTLKVIEALKFLNNPDISVNIVIGPANPNLEILQIEIGKNEKVHLLTDVVDMPRLMAWADVAISAGGSTCWELAFMGLPQIIICLAENQMGNANALGRKTLSINLGWHQNVSSEKIALELHKLLLNLEMRLQMSQRGQALIDGKGGKRICDIITACLLKLRPMLPEDCETVWEWFNEDSVRSASFSKRYITWKEHTRWFHERLSRPFFYMALERNVLPVGQVRFDKVESDIIISVMIDKVYRNRSYGTLLIKRGCLELFKISDVTCIHAYIKLNNKASRAAFIKAGFKEVSETIYKGFPSYHLVIEK